MKRIVITFACTAGLALVALLVPQSASAAGCSFTRDLELGVDGEDVRCLQKYLNSAGYTIATSGVGSPGNETSLFRTLTKEAVIEWQRANGLPAAGFFGPQSRSVYNKLMSASQAGTNLPSGGTSNSQSLAGIDPDEINRLLDQLGLGDDDDDDDRGSGKKSEAEQRLKRAIESIQDEDTDDYSDDDVADAIKKLLSAMYEYLRGNYSEASAEALQAYDKNEDKDVDEDELEDDIEAVRERLEDAEDEIDEADDDGEDVDDAEDKLDEAEDALEEAEDAYEDEDYRDARDWLNEAEELIEEALEEIGIDREDEAREAIEDAEDAIDEAEDAIDEADDNDEDVDTAEELLKAAKEKLDDAEDAFDDEDWDEAKEDAEDAEDLANDAIDEL